jgi:hypothetical protein
MLNMPPQTSDGKCLFVDKLSGDSRANLTPIKVANCGSTDGQGWDVITSGRHINAADSMLVVSTLTNACLDFDPRGPAGGQVTLYSCGGSPDGSGSVAASQIFPFNGERGPLALRPDNGPGKCLAVNGAVVDIADCNDGDAAQKFTFDDDGTAVMAASITTEPATVQSSTPQSITAESTPVESATAESTTIYSTSASSIAAQNTIAKPNDTESIIATRGKYKVVGKGAVPANAEETIVTGTTVTTTTGSGRASNPTKQILVRRTRFF